MHNDVHLKGLISLLTWTLIKNADISKAWYENEKILFVLHKVQEFLWPRWSLDRGKSLLDLLHTERFISRPLIIHAFSIGAFTFAQLLVHMAQDTQKYQPLINRIKGQVYDSMVVGTLETMATGQH